MAVVKKAVKKASPKKAVKKAAPKKAVKKAAPKKAVKKAVKKPTPKKTEKKAVSKKGSTVKFNLGRLGEIDIVLHDEIGELEIVVQDVYVFELYKSETLSDVMDIIDERPEWTDFIKPNQIIKLVEWDGTYNKLLKFNLGLSSVMFLDEMLRQLNHNGKIEPEENFWGIYDTFDCNEVSESKHPIKLAFKSIQKIVNDREDVILSMLNDVELDNDNLIIIASFMCVPID